jgi:hypothetical protein
LFWLSRIHAVGFSRKAAKGAKGKRMGIFSGIRNVTKKEAYHLLKNNRAL